MENWKRPGPKTVSPSLGCLAFTCGWLAWCVALQPLRAGEAAVPDRLLFSASQDVALARKAWTSEVEVHFKDTTFEAIRTALAERSGIKIELTDEARRMVSTLKDEMGFGRGGLWMVPAGMVRGGHFGGEAKAHALNAHLDTVQIKQGPRDQVTQLKVDGPVPLSVALQILLYRSYDQVLAISYQSGKILVGTRAELGAELCVKRSYKLEEGWGAIYQYSHNGQVLSFRMDILDAAAMYLETSRKRIAQAAFEAARDLDGQGYQGFHKRVLANEPYLKIAWDAITRTLTITAPPDAIERFEESGLSALKQPSPERLAKEARVYREERIGVLASAAWERLDEAARLRIREAVHNLDAEEFEARIKAEAALAGTGIVAVFPLLEATGGEATEERKLRTRRLAARLYAEAEVPLVREQVARYIPIAMTADLKKAFADFWAPDRRKFIEEDRAIFERELEYAKQDAKLMDLLRTKYSVPPETPPAKVTFELAFISSYSTRKLREFKIEAVVVCGAQATVAFSYTHDFDGKIQEGRGSVSLTCDHGLWKIALPQAKIEEETIRWSADGGYAGIPLIGTHSEFRIIGANSCSGFASAYATTFSFFDF